MHTIKKTKIFIVDDHPIVRSGLTQIINQEEDLIVAGEAPDIKEAIEGIEKIKPVLAIVDISLKGSSGIELTKQILSDHPKMVVLIISMYDESVYLERAFRAGAKGYLTKLEATQHIITAIRKLLAGDIYISERWKDKLVHLFVSNQQTPTSANLSLSALSDRESNVLHLVGQGYTTRRIATELFVSIKTIESHYANIKNKLDLKNSHELIQYAVKWVLAEQQGEGHDFKEEKTIKKEKS